MLVDSDLCSTFTSEMAPLQRPGKSPCVPGPPAATLGCECSGTRTVNRGEPPRPFAVRIGSATPELVILNVVKDPRLHFHRSGWNTVSCSTALQSGPLVSPARPGAITACARSPAGAALAIPRPRSGTSCGRPAGCRPGRAAPRPGAPARFPPWLGARGSLRSLLRSRLRSGLRSRLRSRLRSGPRFRLRPTHRSAVETTFRRAPRCALGFLRRSLLRPAVRASFRATP